MQETQETQIRSLGWEDPLEEEMAIHSSILVRKNPWMQSMCVLSTHTTSFQILGVLCLVAQSCPTLCNPMDCSPQPPLSMGFSRQEHWSGLPCPPPGNLPHPGIKLGALHCRWILSYLSYRNSNILSTKASHVFH